MNKKSFKKGFTLIEMLVVIAVIGILASIVVLGTGSARVKARDTKRIADAKQAQNYLEATYSASTGYDCGAAQAKVDADPSGGTYGVTVTCQGTTGYTITADLEGNNAPDGSKILTITSDEAGGSTGGSGRE